MALDFAADPLAELTHYHGLGVDGVFVDCPSTAREWKLATGQRIAQPESWLGTVVGGPGKTLWWCPIWAEPCLSMQLGCCSQLMGLHALHASPGMSHAHD